jgi:hypothetical protein
MRKLFKPRHSALRPLAASKILEQGVKWGGGANYLIILSIAHLI